MSSLFSVHLQQRGWGSDGRGTSLRGRKWRLLGGEAAVAVGPGRGSYGAGAVSKVEADHRISRAFGGVGVERPGRRPAVPVDVLCFLSSHHLYALYGVPNDLQSVAPAGHASPLPVRLLYGNPAGP